MQTKILVLDDEKEIADLVALYLNNEGYEVHKFYDSKDALEYMKNNRVDLALLDVMMPEISGFEICRIIREKYMFPVIMLTAKVEDVDKIQGLSLGADDYITKPFGMMEFVSRVRAVLRRSKRQTQDKILRCEDLSVNVDRHEVMDGQRRVELTLKEFEMLRYLMENQGIVLSRDRLLEHIWGYDFDGETRTVDVHIRTLRQKLGDCGNLIETIRGVGYRIGDGR